MKRKLFLSLSLGLVLLGLALVDARAGFMAPAGTPAATGAVVRQLLGQGVSAAAPDRVLLLQRRTFAPGGDSGAHPAPGPVVLSVESGAVVFSVQQGAALVTRAGAAPPEAVATGSATTLRAGDAVFYDQGVVHDVRNDSAQPAVTLEARLNPRSAAGPATPTR